MKITYTKKELERLEQFGMKIAVITDSPITKIDAAALKEECKSLKFANTVEDENGDITMEFDSEFVIDCIDLYEGPMVKLVNLALMLKDTFTGIFNAFTEKIEEFTDKWILSSDDEEEENEDESKDSDVDKTLEKTSKELDELLKDLNS